MTVKASGVTSIKVYLRKSHGGGVRKVELLATCLHVRTLDLIISSDSISLNRRFEDDRMRV